MNSSNYRTEDAIVDEPDENTCPVCGDALAAREYKSELECLNGQCQLILLRAEDGKWRVWNPSAWDEAETDDLEDEQDNNLRED